MTGKHRHYRNRASQWLREFRHSADQLPDAAVLLDASGRTRWFNLAAGRLLGLLQPRDRGIDLSTHFGGSELGAWLRHGSLVPANDMASPLPDGPRLAAMLIPVGRSARMLLARDISAISRLEQMRRDFVANVSHELRTPLTVIHGYLELLSPDDVPELAAVLDEMRTQSRRMGQIVEDLLTLSRLETQQAPIDEHVAMAPLLATLQREAQALSQGRHRVELVCRSSADLIGSAHDLHSAFSNLVSNAVRYTPSGGSIAIHWEDRDAGVRFAVRDSGYGIPAEHLSRLTERFYRVSSSRSRATGGTGLGLSIVKHVLSLHQAELHIDSRPGEGSTFSCEFPVARILRAAD